MKNILASRIAVLFLLFQKPRLKQATLSYLLIFTFSSMQLTAWASPINNQKHTDKNIAFEVKNSSLTNAIKMLSRKSGQLFTYNQQDLDQYKVSMSTKSATVNQILQELLKGIPLTYKLLNNKYVIFKKAPSSALNSTNKQQQLEIKGTIKDTIGNPLQGVTIVVENHPNLKTASDANGMYILQIPTTPATLIFRMVGYLQHRVEVTKSGTMDIVMNTAQDNLEEVVVVGYGVQKKASVIGAISTVSRDLLDAPVSKLSNSLAGKLSGVVAVQRSGEPGAGSTFWIRGISTLGNASPLVLVDGIERSIDLVEPDDIQEFSILKDAAATAVYGVRGANGVVLITTRTGKQGKPDINVKMEYGTLSPTRLPKMADANQFVEMYNVASGFEYYSQDKINAYRDGTDPDLYPNINWIEALYKDQSANQRINMNVSGGNNTADYYISGSYYGENGLFKADNLKAYNTSNYYKSYNFRSNVNVNILKYTKLNINVATKFERKNDPGASNATIWDYALKTSPNTFPLVYSNGYFPGPGDQQGFNPYALLTQTGYRENFWNNAQSLFGLTQDLGEYVTPGLNLNIKASFDATNASTHNRTRTAEEWFATGRDEDGELIMQERVPGIETLNYSESRSGRRIFYLEASANYSRSFDKHHVGGLILYQQSQRNVIGVSSSQDALPYKNQGIAARGTYDFDNRYFIEGNFGYNGSENFSPGKRFGFFPSIALGWMLSNEKFFEPITTVFSNLKFRASYGKVGNNEIGGNRRFIYLGTVNRGNTGDIRFGESASTKNTYSIGDWPNESVSWEEATKMNAGVDFLLFNKLNIQADYFKENRTGIFLQRGTIPQYVGITTTPYVNVGEMRNSGVDVSMKYNQRVGEFNLSALGNFTFTRNIILNQDQPEYEEAYLYSTGQARWQKFGYVANGYFQSEQDILAWPEQQVGGQVQPGDLRYLDLNGDGVVNTFDRKAIGYTDYPEIIYGFGLSAMWKSLDFSAFFQGNANVEFMYNSDLTNAFTARNMNESNVFADVYENYWTPENPNAKYPRLTTAPNPNNNVASTHWLANGEYLRLKNIELGFTLPDKITDRLHVKGLRVYASGVNIITWSAFKLWDPDLQTGASTFPLNKVYNFGLNLNF